MSLNMNNTFLFMNWVLERSDSDSNDFQAFVLYMRNSLTPQLWEDFMKSDSALSLTQSFVDSVKQKVVPKPKKPRAPKKTETTPENTPSNEDGVLRETEPVEPNPKKARAPKKVAIPVEEPTPLIEDGVSNTTQEEDVLREPSQVEPKPKKARAPKKTEATPENAPSNEDGVLRETEPVAPKTKKSGARSIKKPNIHELSEVVGGGGGGDDEYQEIQLQLVNVDGHDAFIDSHNHFVNL